VPLRTLLLDVGYLDHVGLLLALACTRIPHRPAGDLARLALCLAGVLVHEAFVVAFLPLVLLDVILVDTAQGGRGPWPALALGVVVAGAALVLSSALRLPEDALPAYLAHVRARAGDVVVEAPAVDVLARGTDESVRRMGVLWSEPARWRTLGANGAFALLPALAWAGAAVRVAAPGAGGAVRTAAIGATVLAPLCLHAVAWDLCRFDALAALGGFVALALVLARPGPAVVLPTWARVAAAVAVLAEAAVVAADAVPVTP
jgi:hypothetical protein